MNNVTEYLKSKIRDIPDFPKKGIVFKDITTLLKDKEAFKVVIDEMAKNLVGEKIDYIVGIESRGFIFGGALAYNLGVGFIPIRKPKKLPGKTKRMEYSLEYGTDAIEIHEDAIEPGSNVVLIDDLLATGGTMAAAVELVKQLNANIIKVIFLIELGFLNGKEKLSSCKITSLITY